MMLLTYRFSIKYKNQCIYYIIQSNDHNALLLSDNRRRAIINALFVYSLLRSTFPTPIRTLLKRTIFRTCSGCWRVAWMTTSHW